MKKLVKILLVFMSVMFIGMNVSKAVEGNAPSATTKCAEGETQTTEADGRIKCLYPALVPNEATSTNTTCSKGTFNETTKKCEYNANVTQYRCSTSSIETDCEVVSFQDGENPECPSDKHQNDQGEHYINCCKYGCTGGGFLSTDEKTCFVYSQSTHCPDGYSNARENKWECDDESHTLSSDHKCSYDGTLISNCSDETHELVNDGSVTNCVYYITVPEESTENNIVFERDRYTCDVNEIINTYAVSSNELSVFATDYTEVAIVEAATNGKCPASEANCREINITCIAAGSAHLTVGDGTNESIVEAVVGSESTTSTAKITYDFNNGNACEDTDLTVTVGQAIGTLCKPTRKGYNFNGWFTQKTGGVKVTSETIAQNDMTIYAQWKKAESNPKTGITEYAFILLGLIAVSGYVFVVVNRRNRSFY